MAKYQLSINVRGKSITQYEHNGQFFIEGRKGSDFTIEFSNNSAQRVLVVPSVDGLSTLDGKPATADSPGYVVQANGKLSIPGWTLDNNAVAKFQFQDKDRSYTRTVTGTTSNAGVIGVAVFRENTPQPVVKPLIVEKHIHHYPTYPSYPPYFGPIWTNTPVFGSPQVEYTQGIGISSSNGTAKPRDVIDVMNMSGSLSSVSASTSTVADPSQTRRIQKAAVNMAAQAETPFEIGTGWGSKEDFKVKATTFDKGDLDETIQIYYDSRRNLERRGIQIRPTRDESEALPQAFAGLGCTPPKGWTG